MNFQPITLIHRVSTNYYHSAGCDGMVALLVVVLSILSLVFIYQLSHAALLVKVYSMVLNILFLRANKSFLFI